MLSIALIGSVTLYLFPVKNDSSNKNDIGVGEKLFDFKNLRARESFNENRDENELIKEDHHTDKIQNKNL
jgi:hypothetical protein